MKPEREDPDRADVLRVLGGEPAAFENLVLRWQGPLVNLAYRFCHDFGRAEEFAQEAFLRAYRFLGRWRQDSAFSTWLFAVAINVYRSQMRRVPSREVNLDAYDRLADPASPHREIERRNRAEVVRRGVCALPEKYRDALVLFYFHDLDITATAQTLGLAEGTVKARLHRGRKLLQRRLTSRLRSRLSTEVT